METPNIRLTDCSLSKGNGIGFTLAGPAREEAPKYRTGSVMIIYLDMFVLEGAE
jgi:hypothetical protein